MDRASTLRVAVRQRLLPWFRRHRRALPWRRRRTPYRVWIAELMLQQTRVDQALPYYIRFLEAFPSVRALASAPRRRVLKLWEGLGYYARARRLHETAKHLVRKNGGRFPRAYDELLGLPGIGPYTAAAMGSLAFNLPVAVVDGNVARVLSRLLGYRGDVTTAAGRAYLQRWADRLLPVATAGDYNEAMMELGALVCLPRSPRCDRCPLEIRCRAYDEGRVEKYPVKGKQRAVPHKVVGAAVVVRRDGRILIAQRKETSMLGGLWEFPGGTRERGESMEQCIARELMEELGVAVEVGPHLVTVRHAFSHFTMDLHAHWARITRGRPRAIHCNDFRWVHLAGLKRFPFPRADLRVLAAVEQHRRSPS